MIRLESAEISYGSRVVLEGVSLELRPGEVLGLLGPNGAGKSTLLRAASGVLAPRAGSITVDGSEVSRLRPADRAKRIAVVQQAAQTPDTVTVEETVLLGRVAHMGWLGRETQADREATEDALHRTGTASLSGRRLGEISGGERQLVLIARALAQRPAYLLLDEPTAHLDLRHEARILQLLRDLAHSSGLGILAALHDLNVAARHADRVALLAGGRLQASGPPVEVLTQPLLSAAYGVPVSIFREPSSGAPVIFAEPGKKRLPSQK